MAVYDINNMKYAIAQEATVGTAVVTAGKLILATNMVIPINTGINKNYTPRQRGLPYPKTGTGQDFKTLNIDPSISLPYMGNADTLALALATLTQNVGISAGTPNVYTFAPYSTAAQHTVEYGDTAGSSSYSATILKVTDSGLTKSETMSGAICRSLTLGSSNDSHLAVTAEWAGMTHTTGASLASTTLTDFATAPIIHSDFGANVEVGGSPVDLIDWSMTITNNAQPVHTTYAGPRKWILGKLMVDLRLVMPWDETDWITNIKTTDYLFQIWKGSKVGTTAGDFFITCNFDPKGDIADADANNLKVWNINGIGAYDGTNAAFGCVLASSTALITSMAP